MDYKRTDLHFNPYIDAYENADNWEQAGNKLKTCDVSKHEVMGAVCHTELGAECFQCVVTTIENSVKTSQIEGITLAILRQAMSSPKSIRWRFFFTIRFKEIYELEKESQYFGLKVLLMEQLGYVTPNPLSNKIREIAYEQCITLGDEMTSILTKLYRQHPWQLMINIIQLVGRFSPADDRFQKMLDDAVVHPEVEVRLRTIHVLKDIDSTHMPWVRNALVKLCFDSNRTVSNMAKKYVDSPVRKNEPAVANTNQQISFIGDHEVIGIGLQELYDDFRLNNTKEFADAVYGFSEIYTHNNLKTIFASIIIPLLTDQGLMTRSEKNIHSIKKKQLTTILTHIVLDKELFSLFWESIPADIRDLIESAVWYDARHYADELEKKLKLRIMASESKQYFRNPEVINPYFLLFQTERFYEHGYFGYKTVFYLASTVRIILKRVLPLPAAAQLKTVESIPAELAVYSDDNQFAHQVLVFLEYIRQGGIQITKTAERVTKASLKKWDAYFRISDFYPQVDRSLQNMYSNIVTQFLLAFRPEHVKLTGINDIKKLILSYFEYTNFRSFDFIAILFHVKGYFYSNPGIEQTVRKTLLTFLKRMAEYSWLDIENIIMSFMCNEKNEIIAQIGTISHGLQLSKPLENRNDFYYRYDISTSMYNDILFRPMIKSWFFLFAALGLVDIAYEEPCNENHRIMEQPYLTVYDGLKYVRLNEFGKYIVGLNDNYKFESDDETQITLDQKRLMITVEGSARLERMILDRFADKIGENYYKISYQSFLQDCLSVNDIKNKISIFKDKISAVLPNVWKEFFDEIDGKINPLEQKSNLRVFKIKPSKELVSLIARDEVLKKYILKVEDYHIAIEDRNLSKVKKRLQEFGFFIDKL
ncbi:hypothetical protein JW960_02805 [candidate division KSB1 bacterium]|nr:hypothetical protein [candidate division KSB1 bacterium]